MEYTMDCGCRILPVADIPSVKIFYCPKHKAAPALYEALRGLLIFLVENGYTDNNLVAVINRGTNVLAKIERQTVKH